MKFEIVCDKNSDYIEELDFEIKGILSRYPHRIKIEDDFRGRRYQIQSESQTFIEMKDELLQRALSYLLYSQKRSYYANKLKNFLSADRFFILSRVLIFSDFDIEKAILAEKLKNASVIVLDGICNFMLADFKKEWERACTIVNLSCDELKNDDSFKEFIKSMSSSIHSKYQILYLFCGSKNMVLSDKLEKIPATILGLEHLSSEERIISTLIENYPMNVAIYEESKVQMVTEALGILFDARKKSKSIKSV